jgi:hypothetical protein
LDQAVTNIVSQLPDVIAQRRTDFDDGPEHEQGQVAPTLRSGMVRAVSRHREHRCTGLASRDRMDSIDAIHDVWQELICPVRLD